MTITTAPLAIGPRTYYLVPGTSDTLWVVLHGGMGTAATIEHNTAPWGDAWVAYPEGTPGTDPQKLTWNAGTCCGAAVAKGAQDVLFIQKVVAAVSEQHPTGLKHVNVAGFSNGAMMVYRLLMETAAMLDCAVVVSGTACVDGPFPSYSNLVPLLHIHGDEDANVPYMGGVGPASETGVNYRSVPDSLALVIAQRGKPFPQKLVPHDGYMLKTWSGKGGALVQLKLLYGGTHQWPSDGTQEAMAFAEKFGA